MSVLFYVGCTYLIIEGYAIDPMQSLSFHNREAAFIVWLNGSPTRDILDDRANDDTVDFGFNEDLFQSGGTDTGSNFVAQSIIGWEYRQNA